MRKLRRAADDYLALRRALGFRLPRYEGVLHRFVSFLDGEQTDQITIARVVRWANDQSGITARWRALQVGIVRGFARYWSARDPRTEVPPAGLVAARRRRRAPYLYTQKEIRQLMDAARRMQSRDALWPATLSTLFGLLAVTGVRIGEALALASRDVDLERGVLVVQRTKFRKSRLVPLRASTCRALAAYAAERDRQSSGSLRFFVSANGGLLQHGSVHAAFRRLSRIAGIVSGSARLHDFRHRLAVHTLVRWYRAGHDVERRLPILSAYLGHCCPRDTYWYLSASPELMGHARARFERHWAASP
jgi:integrase